MKVLNELLQMAYFKSVLRNLISADYRNTADLHIEGSFIGSLVHGLITG